MSVSPVAFKEVLQLTQLGIQAAQISFKTITVQSDKYVVVNQGRSLAVVDCATKNVLNLPVPVDSAIMNPLSKVVAVRSKASTDTVTKLKIYNLEMKTNMKSSQIAGDVSYWRWLDAKTIAIVGPKSVYHWSMEGNAEPQKIFDRAPAKGQVQIINYRASADKKWYLLGGISPNPQSGLSGVLQVYSMDLKRSQDPMDAHAACFASVAVNGKTTPSNLFCYTKLGPQPKLAIIEVGVPKQQAFMKSVDLPLPQGDFPVAMIPDNKYGVLFLLTKGGLLFILEIESGKTLFQKKASQSTMFHSIEANTDGNGGILTVDQSGRVARFFIDKNNIIKYISDELNDMKLAGSIAARCNLGGGSEIFAKQFQTMMQQGNYNGAIQLAATSPQGSLRTLDTINALRPINNGQTLFQYFLFLIKQGPLNEIESIELVKPILAKGAPKGLELIKGWIQDQKLKETEDLGDLLKNTNIKYALAVYHKAGIHEKVISCFLSLGAQEPNDAVALDYFKKVLSYSKAQNFQPIYTILLQQLVSVRVDRAKDFAVLLLQHEDGPKVDIQSTIGFFLQQGDVKNTTNILLTYLSTRGDKEEDAALQTKLLEINLLGNKPQVAEAILESEDYKFSHYDRLKIAQLCERVGLFHRALEHYTDLMDVKRVLHSANNINPEFLLSFFGKMEPEDGLECMADLLKGSTNLQKNIRRVVDIAKRWSDYYTADKLIELFESVKSYNGLYFYLANIVNFTEDSNVVFKYIEAATNLGQMREVERVCRDSAHYDSKQVKEYLIAQNLKDPRPLIHVCDKYGYVDELTQYLYQNQLHSFIDAYVQRKNPKAAPAVVGCLLDLNANEDQIKSLIAAVRPPSDAVDFISQLVAAVEKRNRLKILRTWLEERAAEGNTDAGLHNGLAKIYVDINNQPQQFLTSNKYYDSKVVGAYCEQPHPHLAFIAYKRAWGECDAQLIEVTNANGFFKDQARYLVERQDLDLWATVLTDSNEFKQELIDQVVSTALPESRHPDQVSSTVKAFMAANLPNELIELLEKIILHGPQDGEFAQNKSLQNLLILTAIKADKKRVMDYIKRLENYDGPDIAKIAISSEYELYEEAFFIFKKFKKGEEALTVLLENLEDIRRGQEFAEYWDKPEVWSILGRAQLDQKMVKEAIVSYIKADDASHFGQLIFAAKQAGEYTDLIKFITMAKKKAKDPELDNNLIYCLAKEEKLADLEDFIVGPNVAKIQEVGEILFSEEMYQAAKLLFNHVNNNAKLSICLVKLEQYQEAVDAARKANAMETWKAVCFSCVDAGKFRLAQLCALNIIIFMDHLQELCLHYERKGHFDELIKVLEQGTNLERSHQGIYTQLGIAYSKYKEDKLMEHIKLFWSRCTFPVLLAECVASLHFQEAVFLLTHNLRASDAILMMIEHSAECFEHKLFKEVIQQVSKTDVFYKAIDFYLLEHPLDLKDLLIDALIPLVDHSRVVHLIEDADQVALVQKYLEHVQNENLVAVNEALHKLYLQQEDYKSLRNSVDNYTSFDQVELAIKLEKHDLVEFRRIAANIFLMNKKYEKSINLSKQDELWQDAMTTCKASGDSDLAEGLLRFFVAEGNKPAFTACLYTCCDLVKPDVVLELAWRFNLMNFAMPFMIQTFKTFGDSLTSIQTELAAAKAAKADVEAEAKAKEQESNEINGYNMQMASLPPPPGQQGYGGQQQQQQQHNGFGQQPGQFQQGGLQNTNAFF